MDDDDTILIMYIMPGVVESPSRSSTDDSELAISEASHQTSSGRRSRESTVQPDERSVRLTFSNGPKTSFGFVVGVGAQCDCVLPSSIGISRHHFAFQFDDQYRLVVKDLASSLGTAVIYDDRNQGPRVGKSWIIGGCEFTDDVERIHVNIAQWYDFRLWVPSRKIDCPAYREKVDRFRRGTAGAENLFNELKIRTEPPTELGSRARTPSDLTRPIVIKKPIGRGGFAEIFSYWNAETGDEWAVKRPLKNWKRAAWKQEADIMRRVSHVG